MEFRETLISIVDKLLTIVPYLAIVAVLILTMFLLIVGNVDTLLTGLHILISIVIISLILILNRKTIQNNINLDTLNTQLLNIKSTTLNKIYILVYTITVILVLLTQKLTTPFIGLIIVLYSITIFLIFSKHEGNKATVPLQLILTTGLFIFVKFISYGYIFHIADSIAHINVVELIVRAGSTITLPLSEYTNFFTYHLGPASTSLLTNLNSYASVCITHILFVLVSGIFVYLLSKEITKSDFISEIAVFFYFCLPGTVISLSTIMPAMFAGLLLLILLYLLISINRRVEIKGTLVIIGVVTLFTITVHHASLIFTTAMLLGLILTLWLYKKPLSKYQIVGFLLIGLIITIRLIYAYLMNTFSLINTLFLSRIKTTEINIINEGRLNNILSQQGLSTIQIQTAINIFIILFTAIAIYHLISKKHINCPPILKLFLPIVIIIFPFMLHNLTSYIPIISSIEDGVRFRVEYYMAPYIAILMGAGCLILYRMLNNHKFQKRITIFKKTPAIICILFCISCVIVAIPFSENGGGTYPILDESTYIPRNTYFTYTEMAAVNSFSQIIPNQVKIATDVASYRMLAELQNLEKYDISTFSFLRPDLRKMFLAEPYANTAPYVLFMEYHYVSTAKGLLLYNINGGTSSLPFSNDGMNNFKRNTNKYAIIYNNGEGKIHAL